MRFPNPTPRARRMRLGPLVFSLVLAFLSGAAPGAEPEGFTFKDGDRVVLLGNTFLERAQTYGSIETLLTAWNPDKNITFRNLAWSGDTVFCHARSYFGNEEEGFQRLQTHIALLKPTAIIACYGSVAAFEGESGIDRFMEGYTRLLEMAGKEVPADRIVLLTPPPLENLAPPLPNQDAQNHNLRRYRDAIQSLAGKRGHYLADLFSLMGAGENADTDNPLTENGVHLTGIGYEIVAPLVAASLGMEPPSPAWNVDIDAAANKWKAKGTTVTLDVARAPSRVTFTVRDSVLPAGRTPDTVRSLRVSGLSPGRYRLTIDGDHVLDATAEHLGRGVALLSGPEFDAVERLRRSIRRKNILFFHRWRPTNETYLFGFRKHEQGNNAVEIPQLDPLVAAAEKTIARLGKPAARHYQLVKLDAE